MTITRKYKTPDEIEYYDLIKEELRLFNARQRPAQTGLGICSKTSDWREQHNARPLRVTRH